MARLTPLAAECRIAGATMAPVGAWELPLHYDDPIGEYHRTLERASIFDISHQGKLQLLGKDAPSFLHNLCTNDINGLPLGGGCEAYFCDHRAKVLAHALVYHVLVQGQHAFWLDVTPDTNERVFQHLDKHLISEVVELADLTTTHAQIHLAGPQATAILSKALGYDVPALDEFLHMERTLGRNAIVHVRRHDPLGVAGYDVMCAKEVAATVWQTLNAAGAMPAGTQAFNLLRVEAGTPIFGIDIQEDRFVMEVARALRAVSYNKGCYLGQEPIVMARDRAGFVNRAFLGVQVLDGPALPVGTKLLREQTEVGVVTSSIDSPRMGKPLSLCYLRRGHQDPGTNLLAVTPTGTQNVAVLPFPPVASIP